jgi:putative two-component system response regulator
MRPPRDGAPRPTVLVVDDNPENLAVLSAVLRPDYRVRVATDGAKAIAIVESADPPDLVLLDVMMPGMSGFEVCRRLKASPARRDVPIVFVTALGDVEDERQGLELGAIDYLTKPVSPAIVGARVANHLELARARAALAAQNALLEAKVADRTADLVRANDELKQSYLETIDLAYAVMSESDDRLGEHCKRVASYARSIARRMGLDDERVFDVYVAGLMHDLGLVSVHGDELLRLLRLRTATERDEPLYFAHPYVNLRVLLTSARFTRTATIIAAHHERLDGSGFPEGLRGDDIPLESRIVAVADRWDVLTQLGPTTDAATPDFPTFAAVHQAQLDPEVLDAFRDELAFGDPFSRTVARDLEALAPGAVVARTIRTRTGAILLRAGTTLRRDHLQNLARFAARDDVALPIVVFRDPGP